MKETAPKTGAFLTDVKELRRRARAHMKRDAVTEGDQGDSRLIEEILTQEEGHAEDLKALIVTLGCRDYRGTSSRDANGTECSEAYPREALK